MNVDRRFRDRAEAGRLLADRLAEIEWHDPVVLALPRGGVPVAVPVAGRLGVPVEVFVARKVGMPGDEEFGIGAVAENLEEMVVGDAAAQLGFDPHKLGELAAREREEVRRRVEVYRGGRPLPELAGRDVILIDDGLATGVTMEAAALAVRAAGPRRLVIAVPVGAPSTRSRLAGVADAVVCLTAPPRLGAIGAWYDDFQQVGDGEVLDLLAAAGSGAGPR
ncbi:phosphoribosyltransferase [Catenulispora subtropica]|uniref:Phosphoribosyltransferase family protein n=1 Tax=Catenulispora subtropica TaxID=450798 RepID=A0ABN2SIZ2_9ACTN